MASPRREQKSQNHQVMCLRLKAPKAIAGSVSAANHPAARSGVVMAGYQAMLPLLASIRFFSVLGLMIFTTNFSEVHSWFRQLHGHVFHLSDDDLRDSQVPKPFVV